MIFAWIALLFASQAWAGPTTQDTACERPTWVSEPGSKNGFFSGHLEMVCQIETSHQPIQLAVLKKAIIEKIQKESEIHSAPPTELWESRTDLVWDVTHKIDEDGTHVLIREEAKIISGLQDNLVYETHSKEVKADGMAGYLRAVNFFMKVGQTSPQRAEVRFRNEVKVERPWYALDLVFSPIAQGICFDKMEKVRKTLFPWIAKLL